MASIDTGTKMEDGDFVADKRTTENVNRYANTAVYKVWISPADMEVSGGATKPNVLSTRFQYIGWPAPGTTNRAHWQVANNGLWVRGTWKYKEFWSTDGVSAGNIRVTYRRDGYADGDLINTTPLGNTTVVWAAPTAADTLLIREYNDVNFVVTAADQLININFISDADAAYTHTDEARLHGVLMELLPSRL